MLYSPFIHATLKFANTSHAVLYMYTHTSILIYTRHLHLIHIEFETLGNTVLEAFSCGIPVVVPRTQGFCDTVSDQVNGYLFEPRSVQDCQRYIGVYVYIYF